MVILGEEQTRSVREGLDEPTQAVFDLLKKDDLTSREIKHIETIAVNLYARLEAELAHIRDWQNMEATRDRIKQTFFDFLYSDETGLPTYYSEAEVTIKSDMVFGHFLNHQQHRMALAAV